MCFSPSPSLTFEALKMALYARSHEKGILDPLFILLTWMPSSYAFTEPIRAWSHPDVLSRGHSIQHFHCCLEGGRKNLRHKWMKRIEMRVKQSASLFRLPLLARTLCRTGQEQYAESWGSSLKHTYTLEPAPSFYFSLIRFHCAFWTLNNVPFSHCKHWPALWDARIPYLPWKPV